MSRHRLNLRLYFVSRRLEAFAVYRCCYARCANFLDLHTCRYKAIGLELMQQLTKEVEKHLAVLGSGDV